MFMLMCKMDQYILRFSCSGVNFVSKQYKVIHGGNRVDVFSKSELDIEKGKSAILNKMWNNNQVRS